MVKYGFGAWAVIGWMVFSSSFRHFGYEVFVLQHICAAATLLWLIHTHVPPYAQYNVYIAGAFLAFDWAGRIISALARNTHALNPSTRNSRKGGRLGQLGYRVRLTALPGDAVRVTVYGADFAWRAGQHCYINIPAVRPLELHPFTIASFYPQRSANDHSSHLSLLIKAKSGFTRALAKAAFKPQAADATFRAFLSAPWGQPPDLTHFETVVFVSCDTGASFTTPQLQSLLRNGCCARRIEFHWIVRSEEHFQWLGRDIVAASELAADTDIRVTIAIHVTQESYASSRAETMESLSTVYQDKTLPTPVTSTSLFSSTGTVSTLGNESTPLSPSFRGNAPLESSLIWQYDGRPSVESLIRPAVEEAYGETVVVICGGPTITAQARTFVTVLSDERAVHKGTGAQGIFLFCESYGH